MTNSINQTATVMVFNNSEFGNIRISLDGKGEPLFCGKDVCEVLGYRRTADAVNQHVDISDSVKHRIRCEGLRCGKPVVQYRSVLFVTESGFYALVLGSKLDTAQKFKHWVTAVVLPQIRKTGGFVPLHEGDTDEDIRLDAVGYGAKEAGTSCFMTPKTFELISRLREEGATKSNPSRIPNRMSSLSLSVNAGSLIFTLVFQIGRQFFITH